MKKLRLGIVIFSALLVGVVVIALGTGALFGTADANDPTPPDESRSTNSDSTTVEDVSIRNRTADGVLYLDIAVAGELDTKRLGRSLKRMYDDPTVNVNTIELVEVQGNVATVAIATDDRSSSAHVVQRVEHYLDDTSWDEQSDRPTTQMDGSGSVAGSTEKVCGPATVFYQLDFVQGEVIENLRGPEGYYTPDELIRFAHGSSKRPIVRTSEGVFTTAPPLRRGVVSEPITVENGTATITFSIAAGHSPVALTLASYEKPGSGWNPETESEQVLVDYDTETFGPGGPYTLRVTLPEAEARPCKTTETTTTTVTLRDVRTDDTAAVETLPSTSDRERDGRQYDDGTDTATVKASPSTPAPTATTTPTETAEQTGTTATLDLRVNGNGQSLPFQFGPVQNGEQYSTVLQLRNTGTTPGNYLCAVVTNVGGSENERKEPERDAGVHDQSGSELPQYLDISMDYGRGVEYHRFYGPTALTAEDKGQCVKLDKGLDRDNPLEFRITVAVAHEDISNAMSDSATFTVELTLHDENPNS